MRRTVARIYASCGLLAVIPGGAVYAQPAHRAADTGAPAVSEPDGMVLVPAGEFLMGSQASENWASNDEMPQRVVKLPAFYIDQLEVSNIQFKRFVDATDWPAPSGWTKGRYPEGADFLPVTGISWWDAAGYARWCGKRLPTEAEWEKAARGTDGRRYPWGSDFEIDRANNDLNLLPVGSKAAGMSPYGVLDMAGNVAEWTASAFAPYPRPDGTLPAEFGGADPAPAAARVDESTQAALDTNPAGDAAKIKPKDPRLKYFTAHDLADRRPRTYRGGSFNNYAKFLRCANRRGEDPDARWHNIGFRCAQDAAGNQATRP